MSLIPRMFVLPHERSLTTINILAAAAMNNGAISKDTAHFDEIHFMSSHIQKQYVDCSVWDL